MGLGEGAFRLVHQYYHFGALRSQIYGPRPRAFDRSRRVGIKNISGDPKRPRNHLMRVVGNMKNVVHIFQEKRYEKKYPVRISSWKTLSNAKNNDRFVSSASVAMDFVSKKSKIRSVDV